MKKLGRREFLFIASVGAASVALAACAPKAPKEKPNLTLWQPAEFTFSAQGSYTRPLTEVEMTAVFSGRGGETFQVNGFWDGGNTWKVRFTPTATGAWTYTTICNTADAGLAGKTGAFTVHPAATDTRIRRHGGILRVSADQRHLTYTDGTPFFWLGDTSWFCPSDKVPIDGSTQPGCPSMFKKIIDKRKEQGFTVLQIAFLGSLNGQSTSQFMAMRQSNAQDISYWKQVDRYIEYANAADIVPVIGTGFHEGLDGNPEADWQFLWRYIVARYGAHAVTWLICGEYNAPAGDPAARIPMTLNLGADIKQRDPYQRAMSIHPWSASGENGAAWSQPWYDFIMLQGAHMGHNNVPSTSIYRQAWKLSTPARPVLESESCYEGIYAGGPNEQTLDDVRRVAWHAIQAGSFGYTYGAHGLWYPTQDENDMTFAGDWGTPMVWWLALERPGAAQMTHLRKCYESLEWWKLMPRTNGVAFSATVTDATRPLAKSDGDAIHLVWFPLGSGHTVSATLNLTDPGGSGSYAATWFNPRNGQTTAIAALTATDGQCPLPDRPDAADWVLILKRK